LYIGSRTCPLLPSIFFLQLRRPPPSTLFPYTTLFRSHRTPVVSALLPVLALHDDLIDHLEAVLVEDLLQRDSLAALDLDREALQRTERLPVKHNVRRPAGDAYFPRRGAPRERQQRHQARDKAEQALRFHRASISTTFSTQRPRPKSGSTSVTPPRSATRIALLASAAGTSTVSPEAFVTRSVSNGPTTISTGAPSSRYAVLAVRVWPSSSLTNITSVCCTVTACVGPISSRPMDVASPLMVSGFSAPTTIIRVIP